MISFVLATRNDGYGGELEGVENFTMKRLEITVNSILALGVDSEIIVIDFCTDDNKKPVKDFVSHLPVRVITLKRNLLTLLQEDGKTNLVFYECLSKDIGIKKAKGEYIITCNPDNIFPSINFDRVLADIEKGLIVRAIRLEIDKNYGKLNISTLIEKANKNDFNILSKWETAAGDFTGFRKDIYFSIGGYRLLHGNWHLDNEFIDRVKSLGFEVFYPYSHYHLNHTDSIYAFQKDKNWQNFRSISKEILNRIDEFICEETL